MSRPVPFAVPLAVVLLACGAAPPVEPPLSVAAAPSLASASHPPVRRFDYRFGLDEELSLLSAEICFADRLPAWIRPIHSDGLPYLRSASLHVPGSLPLPLEVSEGRIPLPEGIEARPGVCVRYSVDLRASSARQGVSFNLARRVGADLVASTGIWLWAPWPRTEDAEIRARFELPEGISVSPLWSPEGEDLRLNERALRFLGYVAFGRFASREVPVPGGCLSLSVLDGGSAMSEEELGLALQSSARAVSQIFGHFPTRRASVLLVPAGLSPDASPFGVVGRGVWPSAVILFSSTATRPELARAWVPAHELSHMAAPYVLRGGAWLSEGLATYYQEILRARAGLIPAEEAWDNLYDGFQRGGGRGTGRILREESEQMYQTYAFQRVYWSGAAIALLADLAMRRAAQDGSAAAGTPASLDEALEHLHRRAAGRSAGISAEEALALIEERGDPIFSRVARPALESADFPDLSALSAFLGISGSPGALHFDEGAPGASIRRAVVAPRAQLSPPDCPGRAASGEGNP